MEDVSAVFRRALLNMHKIDVAQSTQNRKELHNNYRKARKDNDALVRRNIDINITPINTPKQEVKNSTKTASKMENAPIEEHSKKFEKKVDSSTGQTTVNNKRLELLAKWKEERAKAKQQEKAHAKPIFKVYHVGPDAFPNLENVNKVIKGKPIMVLKKSQFAPDNHVFRPPSNLKPVELVKCNKGSKQPTYARQLTFNLSTQKKSEISRKYEQNSNKTLKTGGLQCASKSNNTQKKTPKPPGKVEEPIELIKSQKLIKKSFKSVRKLNKSSSTDNTVHQVEPQTEDPKTNDNNVHQVEPQIEDSKTNDKNLRQVEPQIEEPKMNDNNIHQVEPQIEDPKTNENSNIKTRLRPRKSKIDEKENDNTEQATVGRYSLRNRTPKKSVLWNVTNTSETPNKVEKAKFRKTPVRTVLTSQSDSPTSVGSHSTPPDYPIEINSLDNSLECVKTPIKFLTVQTSPLYISPFVTISRGKTSARNEFQRQSSSNDISNFEKYTSPKAGAKYFLNKLEVEIKRIGLICQEWQNYLAGPDVPEVATDSINVALGQSKLLISKKFEQFRGLINRCKINANDDQSVTCQDLHGFWDMIYMQVEDIDKRFDNLKRLKENNWEEMLPKKVKTKSTKSRRRPKKAKATSTLKDFIKAEKQKKKDGSFRDELVEPKVFDGGYFHIKSPIKEKSLSECRRSQRLSQLTIESNKRFSSSPSLTVMKISQAIKQGPNGLTPAKSILKSESTRSTGKKSVLFKDKVPYQ